MNTWAGKFSICFLLAFLTTSTPAAVLYVNLNSANPSSPYASWSTASTDIQSAIDAANIGDQILVTNGIYKAGGRVVNGTMTNRVVVSKAITVQSVNGPTATFIQGYQLPGTITGDGAIRCVYLTNSATLSGFTLTNGATRGASGTSAERFGGAIYCLSASSVVSNCVIVGNSAATQGGGAYQGFFYNCTFQSNFATNGGGAYSSTLIGCTLAGNRAATSGGGAYSSTLTNCILMTNSAVSSGGGAYSGALTNCTLTGNTSGSGGGANSATLINCTLTTNSATSSGGAVNSGILNNCTLTGNLASNGGGANSTTMTGCVLTGNSASNSGGGAEGGIMTNCTFIANTAVSGNGGGADSATLTGCTLINNLALSTNVGLYRADGFGGGANSCTLNNCALANNSAVWGGGASGGTLNNCTLVGNSAAVYGGGAYNGTLNNSIAYYNSAAVGPNYNGGTLNYCCTTPLPASGAANITVEPLWADTIHLSAASPCRGAGKASYASGKDIDGEAWANPPSIGCDEFYAATATGVLSVNIQASNTNAAVGAPVNLSAYITGSATANSWDFGDGTVASNRLYSSHYWTGLGNFNVTFRAFNNSNPGGISATVTVHVLTQPVHYVAINSTNPVSPYTSWATAATNIQDAVNAAMVSGALVLVSNGVYATGSRVVYGALSNRVVVTKPLALQSVNGPGVTWIQGNSILGDSAIRCIYLTNGASLIGFTLTNGGTRILGDPDLEQSGGGIWCASPSVSISNCVITASSANTYGGGLYSGFCSNCILTGNSCSNSGGGAYYGALVNCLITNNTAQSGGGVDYSTLTSCTLTGNSASSGGGAISATLISCTVTSNTASSSGGGVCSGFLSNCTLMANYSANYGGGAYQANLSGCILVGNLGLFGGGVYDGMLSNCICNGNSASQGGGADGGTMGGNGDSLTLINCALTNNTAGMGGGAVCGGGGPGIFINCAFIGNTATNGDGGAVIGGTVTNCTIIGNIASGAGGGARGSTVYNTIFSKNIAASGGGANACTLYNSVLTGNSSVTYGGGANVCNMNNCTLTANSALGGGGAYSGNLNNCIVYYNSATIGPNYNGSTLNYCCTIPLPSSGTNIVAEPLLADAFHLSAFSPGRGAGSALYVSGKDIDGESWANPPSIGCDEFYAATALGPLSVSIQADFINVAVGFPLHFSATFNGEATANYWDFGDGTVLSNRLSVSHAWAASGNYNVTFWAFNNSSPGGVSATMTVHVVTQPVYYVSINNPTPLAPYNSWATAATNIQDAINAATVSGALMLVSNGVYATGGQVIFGALTNRVAVTMPLHLKSVNGPAVTWIVGNSVLGDSAIRGVYLTNGASLEGFTITNGAVRTAGDPDQEQSGGGVWCALSSDSISNCVIVGNYALQDACAVYSGTLDNCSLVFNTGNVGEYSITSEAAYYSTLRNCLVATNYCIGVNYSTLNNSLVNGNSGNGANNSTLSNCVVTGNSGIGANGCQAHYCSFISNSGGGVSSSVVDNSIMMSNNASWGGGANGSTLNKCSLVGNNAGAAGGAESCSMNNCQLIGNSSYYQAGGTENSYLTNCTLIGNSSGSMAGGAYESTLINCTVVSNSASQTPFGGGVVGGTADNCIIYYNTTYQGIGTTSNNFSVATLNNCCTFPLPATGINNITNLPFFVNLTTGNMRLQTNSPCINTGNNAYSLNGTDLDGRPRIVGGTVDIGAYEFQGAGIGEFTAWLQQYGLPTDGSADNADSDGTGMNNWYKWIAGLNPTNPASVLAMLPPVVTNNSPGVTVSWQSVNTRTYYLQRATNLAIQPAFSTLQSNLVGQAGTTIFTDTTATNYTQYFYRIGVQ